MRRTTAVAALGALVVLVPAALAGAPKLTLRLDWTPNPDHIGIFDARDTGLFAHAGLDVAIRSPVGCQNLDHSPRMIGFAGETEFSAPQAAVSRRPAS